MIDKLKLADSYVTFKPTGEEFSLGGTKKGIAIFESDKKYLKYGFKEVKNFRGQRYYQFTIDTKDKVDLFTNAYELRYEAIYQGERFGALVDPKNPIITLRSSNDPGIEGFKRMDKFYWDKDIDISEVELIAIKEPINLLDYLD